MPSTPRERLAELVRDLERHRDAIREFGAVGYVTMVERHAKQLRWVQHEIRDHCCEHGLPLPPTIPPE